MQFIVKMVIAVVVISLAGQLARSRPTLAGLIAVMPLTGLLVMLWVWHDSGGDATRMTRYTLGAVWGIIPAMLFFGVAYFCFRAKLHPALVLGLSMGAWVVAAVVHQWLLHYGRS